ncbi:MAG TPA: YMGG-like glycine zipper-containing protein [Caulobacteraceae bacterium]|nr:YMGG-like glycine zipper-containing protein [Caulobacteraceae bacterium]
MIRTTLALAASAALLAGCGTTTEQRVASGALGGAAAGAVMNNDVRGAVVGGAVGAAAGYAVDHCKRTDDC